MKEKIKKLLLPFFRQNWIFIPFLILSIFYLIRIPIGQTPDEPAHINYIENIANFGVLPDYKHSGVAHHPPLYYLLMTPFYLLFRNVYILRVFSVIFSFLNLLVIKKIIKIIFPEKNINHSLAIATAIFCSLIPMYNFMSVAVSNDSLTCFLGSALIYFTLLALNCRFQKNEFIYWSITFFAAIFTKIVLWPMVFISGITVFFLQKKYRWSTLFVCFLSFIGLCFWFYHNISLYGKWDILGWKKLTEVEYTLVGNRLIFDNPREWMTIVFHSFWGIFSWFSIYLPLSIYSILRKATVIFALPFLLFIHNFFKSSDKKGRSTILIFFLFFLINSIALIKDNFTFFHPQGRYLFSVISIIGFYYTASIYQIVNFFSKSQKDYVFIIFESVPLLILNIISAITINNYYLTI